MLARALEQRDRQLLLLPELLDDEDDWRVDPSLRLSSHRPIAGRAIVWLKQKLLLPLTRWLYDYSRENFARQERLNFALMACVQQLVVENVRLAARVEALEQRRAAAPVRPGGPGVKLACVVQRYGAEVTGGAEAHCRAIAERLAESHDVTVLTSCAKDYLTWRNAYPPGESRLGRGEDPALPRLPAATSAPLRGPEP